MLIEEACCVAAPRGDAMVSRGSGEADLERFALVVTAGDSPGRDVALGAAPIVIGRGLGVDLQIKDPTVSRHHCVVWCIAGRCWVRDLGATNQTRVNNRRSLVCEIVAGDVLVIGETALTLRRLRAVESGGPAAP